MKFNDDIVLEVLQRLPSEEPCVDYKVIPYKKNQDHDFLKDVIAMLNSEAGAGKDKFIIVGVENQTRKRIGINRESWRDDNEWQNLLDKILPRPDVSTGCVEYENNWFGYILISGTNNEWVYEAAESVISSEDDKVKERNIIAKGQAYTRRGSKNYVLMADGRKRLLDKKLPDISVEKQIISEPPNERNIMIALAFVGAWDEKYSGDIEIIERLSKTDFKRFTERVRTISELNQGLLLFSNGCWKIKDHKSYLLSQADYVFDDHMDLYYSILDACFEETDPKYELSPDIRPLASLYNKKQKQYSRTICHSLAETLAILGNTPASFNKCSRHKIISSICQFERHFFKTKNWKIYATYAEELQLLGEACPNVFLEEIGRLSSEKDAAFVQFMTEKEESFLSSQYGYQLGWIIAKIAALEKYFSEAMAVLLSLAEIRPEFLDTMVGIALPWFPQTHAPISMRVGVFHGLARENAELTWKVLMKLMPRATTVANPIQEPKYMQIDALPETVTMQDYRDASIAYIRVANELMGANVERMNSMLSVVDDVDEALEQEIIQEIQKNASSLTEEDKAILWNTLQDFVHKHRKYADAEWALSEDRLAPIDALAEWLVPDSSTLFSIRMFRSQQFSLLEEKGNYEKEEAELRARQVAILQGIYDSGGVKSVLQFTDKIENVRLAGFCASNFLSNADIYELIMSSADISNDAFLHGIIRNLSFDRTNKILEGLSDTKKAKTLAILPLCDPIVEYIKGLEEESQLQYWKNIDAWGWFGEGFTLVEDTIKKLNECGRTDTSISILHSFTRKDESKVNPQLVAETLIRNVDSKSISTHNTYEIQELIKWLQERKADRASLILIEWKYLAFLREDEGYPPINLWEELSSNPEQYIFILQIFTGKERGSEWTDEDKSKMIQHCYHLLESWKRTPGIENTGKINKETLNNWVSVVKKLSRQSGIEKQAMMYFGKAAFYAPADEDGFFIDMEVAKYLQDDKEGSMLSGYHSEAINSRGVHTIDPTGEAEFKIEEQYMIKARAADEKGLIRFAGTLREIAESYHEEGIRNKELG